MAALKLFQIAFLIISFNCISGLSSSDNNADDKEKEFYKKCEEQTSLFLENQQSLEIDLYYDAGGLNPDICYIISMCNARKIFKHVTFTFHVGLSVKKNKKGKLECVNTDEKSKDCTVSYMEACASKLLLDFAEYVCCNYGEDSGDITVGECFKKQSDNLDEFEMCTKLKHETIKPGKILLDNSHKAYAKFADMKDKLPFLSFNGTMDLCARHIFLYYPEKAICDMMAKGVEEACNQ